MLELVLAHGYFRGHLNQNVDGHECGVGEEAGIDSLVGLGSDNLFFEGFVVVGSVGGGCSDAEGLAGLVLERGRAHELAHACVHVKQEIHLRYFGDVALDEYRGFVGVDAGGEIFGEYGFYVGVQEFGVGVRGEAVEVGYEEVAVVVVLNLHEFAQGAVVVSEMEVACGTDATEHYFFLCRFSFAH